MKKWIGTFITVLSLVIFVVAAARSYRTISTRQANAPTSSGGQTVIQMLSVKEGVGTRTIPALAVMKSWATVKIMPETAGKITLLNKREGDTVAAGEVLARIESDELQTQLRVAGAQSNSVEKQTTAAEETIRSLSSQRPALVANEQFWRAEQQRNQKLFEEGAVSRAQAESMANKLAEAKGRLSALEAQINASRAQKQAVASQKDAAAQTVALWKVRNRYAEVVAPVSGIISARLQEEGNYVTPNSVLYQLEDTRACRLIMQIPQQYAQDLSIGQFLSLRDPMMAAWPGFRLARIHPTSNELRQRTIEAESVAPVPNPEYERQFAVNVVTSQIPGIVVPQEAWARVDSLPTASGSRVVVYLVEEESARRVILNPLLWADNGEVILNPADLKPESRLLRLGFMQVSRMPETIRLAKESRP